MAHCDSSELAHHEGRARGTNACELACGPYGGGRGLTRCPLIAVPVEERLRSGSQEIKSADALCTRVILRVLQQCHALPRAAPVWGDDQGAQQCDMAEELEPYQSRE